VQLGQVSDLPISPPPTSRPWSVKATHFGPEEIRLDCAWHVRAANTEKIAAQLIISESIINRRGYSAGSTNSFSRVLRGLAFSLHAFRAALV